jgi:hypothetical protein
MPPSGMLRRMVLVRTDVSEERSASIIRMTRIGELGRLAVTSNRRKLRRNTSISYFTDYCHPDYGGATFLQNVDYYKSHTV